MLKPIINKIQNLLKTKNRKYNAVLLIGICIIVVIILEALKPSMNNIADLGFNGLLVLITFMYTSFTKDILEDGKKSREIEFIQRQLEYFYNPWLLIIDEAKIVASKNVDLEEAGQDYEVNCFWKMSPIIENGFHESYKYHYLADKEIWNKKRILVIL